MNQQPHVSIILVNYNGTKDTLDCLNSLKNLEYQNYNVLVVENGSTDDSAARLKEILAQDQLIISPENLGFAGGNNLGIKKAMDSGADYVLLLNNDTTVDPGFLTYLVNRALAEKNAGVIGGKIYFYSEPTRIWYAGGKVNGYTGMTSHVGYKEQDHGQYDVPGETGYVTGCLMLVPSDVIKKAGLMDESYFLYYEETDWCMRVRKAGYRLLYEPKAVIYHKVSAATSRMSVSMEYYFFRNVSYFVKKNFGFKQRVFHYFYIRQYMLLRIIKSLITRNAKRAESIISAWRDTDLGITGPYRNRPDKRMPE